MNPLDTQNNSSERDHPITSKGDSSSPLFLVVTTIIVLIGIATYFFYSQKVEEPTPVPDIRTTAFSTHPFENLKLEARAVYVYDINHAEALYALNEEVQLPLASLTKVMTAVVAAESLPYDTVVTIDPSDLASEGDSGLLPHESWRARDLLDFMLLVSSNDSAHVLASAAGAYISSKPSNVNLSPEQVFVGAMNKKAQELGLAQTYFLNESGLDKTDIVSGGYGSARDMAHLFSFALSALPSTFNATSYGGVSFTSLEARTHVATNTNELVSNVPGIIASKTGYTDLAGGNLVIAFDAGINRPIVVVVLGSSREGRFKDVEKLTAATLEALQNATP